MYPILFEWNGFFIPAWHFFYMLAAIAGLFFLFQINLEWGVGLSPNQLSRLYAFSYIGGYFGARIFSIFIDQWKIVKHSTDFFWLLVSFGPMTFYGGMFGASIAAIFFASLNKIALSKIVDLGIPCGLLGLSIGRIGCFLNGDDYGIPVPRDMYAKPPWWTVTFQNHHEKIPRIPVQLIESILVFTLVMVVYKYKKKSARKIPSGFCGFAMINSYAVMRFFLEFFRGDPRGWVIENHLSTSQFLSLVIITILSPLFYMLTLRTKEL